MSKKGLPAIHPGEFLAEALEELGFSQAAFARAIGVSPMRISLVIKGARPVTAELALLFGRAFNQSPQYWLNLQSDYELKTAKASISTRLIALLLRERKRPGGGSVIRNGRYRARTCDPQRVIGPRITAAHKPKSFTHRSIRCEHTCRN
jgi:addiction module HigA family antidote